MAGNQDHDESGMWETTQQELHSELDRSRRELKEIALMLEQSQLEVNKLTQRNASITAHLQQVQGQFESLPRADIRMAYDSALDAQQRLFVMRGQVEKLQSDQNHLNRQVQMMERVLDNLDGGMLTGAGRRAASETAEMVERMIQAQEAERQRLARQMHDGPAQALSNFILQTEIAVRLFDIDAERAKSELSNLKSSATTTFQKVRDFIFELRPMMLDDLGLAPTLKRYVEAFQETSGAEVRLALSGTDRRLESYQEVMVFRAVQELLSNALRHSNASEFKVQLDMGDTHVRLAVEDNGKGFDPEIINERNSMGLKVIRERVEMLGGAMEIDSVHGQGTRIAFHIPAVHAGGGDNQGLQ